MNKLNKLKSAYIVAFLSDGGEGVAADIKNIVDSTNDLGQIGEKLKELLSIYEESYKMATETGNVPALKKLGCINALLQESIRIVKE